MGGQSVKTTERGGHGYEAGKKANKDCEFLPETSKSVIRIALIKLMTRRLATK